MNYAAALFSFCRFPSSKRRRWLLLSVADSVLEIFSIRILASSFSSLVIGVLFIIAGGG